MEFDCANVSKYESQDSILAAASWLSAQPDVATRLLLAVENVEPEKTFGLLCVMDAVIKQSREAYDAIVPFLTTWVSKLPFQPHYPNQCEAIVLYWSSIGVCKRNTRFFFIEEESDRPSAHMCPVCKRRFANMKNRDTHLDWHVRSRLKVFAQQEHVKSCQGIGIFYAQREIARVKRERKRKRGPVRVCSPIRVLSSDDRGECAACGDSLHKQFDELQDAWVWLGCVRVLHKPVHDECQMFISQA